MLQCFGLLLLLLAFGSNLNAQKHHFKYVHPKTNSVRIPFKLVNNLVVIPLRINDSDTLNFILDTGVRHTLVTQLSVKDSLQLNYYRHTQLLGLGKGDPIPAVQSYANTLYLPGLVGQDLEVVFLEQAIIDFSSSMGMNVHGLLGYDLFQEFVVDINYVQKHLTLRRAFVPKRGRWTAIPLTIQNGKPYIKATVWHQQDTAQVKLLADLGASFALSLYQFGAHHLPEPTATLPALIGRGLNGEVHGKIGRTDGCQLGTYRLNSPVANYPDSAFVAASIAIGQRQGILGAGIFRRFHCRIHYADSVMWIKPNRYFKSSFTYNRSGIEVLAPVPGLAFYRIVYAPSHSPGYKAGLREGDQITYLNRQPVTQMTIDEVLGYLHGSRSKKVKVEVSRNGQPLRFVLELKDQL